MPISGPMLRTDNEKDDIADITSLLYQIIDKCLRGHEENSFLAPLLTNEAS